jgi:hypothetical protein
MNKKIFKTFGIIIIWAIGGFLMSMFYYWLKSKGLIWDNPDQYRLPDGTYKNSDIDWNGRKVIFAIVAIASFTLTIVSIVNIWNDNK